MKFAIVLAVIMCSLYFPTGAQRSPYAPRPVGVPQVLPQYETAENRFGEPSTPAPPKPVDPSTLEDVDLVNRVSSWPKEKQPYWFVNKDSINNNRGQPFPCSGPNCSPSSQRSAGRWN